jgi:hypothetical protein
MVESDLQSRIQRAAERIWVLADADPQLRALKTKEEVSRRLQDPNLSYQEICAAARPASRCIPDGAQRCDRVRLSRNSTKLVDYSSRGRKRT